MAHEPIPVNPPRLLTPEEEGILSRLLSVEFPGRAELVRQSRYIRVSEECKDCRSIKIVVNNLPENAAAVKRRIPVEAEATDTDGTKVHILLHIVRGYIDEIEIFREDLQIVKQLPKPDSLQLISLDDDS